MAIRITQVYYNGGIDADASYANDFVELYNESDTDLAFNGEYALAVAPNGWQKILEGTIKARSFYLVQYASWFQGGAALPTPDFVGASQDLDGGKWLLFYYQAGGGFFDPTLIDDVDFRSSNSSPAPTTSSSSQSVLRKKTGNSWQDTGVHGNDFQLGPPFPRNSAYVAKTTPTFTWTPISNTITYPNRLSTNQLNAFTPVAGSVVYSNGSTSVTTNTILNAGTYQIVASFTPTDTNAYNIPSPITNTLVVNKGTPTLTWASPAAITYGTSLSVTQNNATSTVAGSYSYNPTNGSLLNAGTSSLVVTFTPSDTNYNSPILKTNTLTINKATQTITFAALADKVVGDSVFSLSASVGSGLTVSFASSDSNVATVSGTSVSIVGKGTSSITASQAGNSNYLAAPNVAQVLTVKSRFAAWGGTETMTTQSVGLYAIGGASSSSATPEQPTNSANGTNLTLTAVVRTNDPKLVVVGEARTNLTDTNSWSTNGVTSTNAPNQTNVPYGHSRKIFSVSQTNSAQKFLRLKAILSP